MPETYNASMVRRITGITQRCLDYWDQCGIVSPSVDGARGKGKERTYSHQDLVKLIVVRNFRQTGLSLQKIQRGLSKLSKKAPNRDPLLSEVLITDGKTIFRRTDNRQLSDILAGGQMVLSIVQVGLVHKVVSETVLKLEKKEAAQSKKSASRRARIG
jgi:DNA-binding transcriptional MerR regulator